MTYQIDSFTGDMRWLSNFWMCPVAYEGLVYPSSEHAYQAAKTLVASEREVIRSLLSPGQAKRAGRRVTMRRDWDQVKVSVMLDIVRDKFQRNESLARNLLNTGDLPLIEGNHWGDRFWGVCNGVGENHLGRILMQIRAELHT